ncbi:MAG: transglutaminase family protein [Alkalispirochaetaceae bacterium]
MIFSIRHETEYRYSREVFLEPHTVRLRPRDDGSGSLLSYSSRIEPAPSTKSSCLDPSGNVVEQLHFTGLHARLLIVTETEVSTERTNPFDYLPAERATRVPIAYTDGERQLLSPFLLPPEHPDVKAFATEVLESLPEEGGVSHLLSELTLRLSSGHRTVVRPEGEPFPPEKSVRTTELSCRDLAVLFVALCRALGIASRFVSGYQAGDPDQDARDLHAWAEVYIPGGGWRGYDPTLGLAVADEHIAVAAAGDPADAAPVTGSFRATGASATITTAIELHRL